jgi:hypothetical protein
VSARGAARDEREEDSSEQRVLGHGPTGVWWVARSSCGATERAPHEHARSSKPCGVLERLQQDGVPACMACWWGLDSRRTRHLLDPPLGIHQPWTQVNTTAVSLDPWEARPLLLDSHQGRRE